MLSKKTALLIICVVMYAAAAAHIGVSLGCAFEDSRRSTKIQNMVLDCLGDNTPCALSAMPDAYWDLAADAPGAMLPLSILVSINVSAYITTSLDSML